MPLKILMQVQSLRPPKGNSLRKKYHTMYRLLRLVHPFFAQFTLLPNPQNPMLYITLQSTRHPNSAFSHGGIYIPM